MTKKIIMTGATGLIGSHLAKELTARGYNVVVFTRNVKKGRSAVPSVQSFIKWDYNRPENWQEHLENAYAFIHLAGAGIGSRRFTESYKKKVRDSRILSTMNIVKAISACRNKPEVFVCASGINYYGDSGDKVLTEDVKKGNDFLADVCAEWENEAAKAEGLGVRRVSIRTSPVLSSREGMLKKLLPLFKFYLGASLGSGKQWFSWIHIDDIVKAYVFALENENISGPVNASSPDPLSMNGFVKQFGKVLHRPVLFRIPLFVLRAITGETADYVTASLRVIPQKLQNTGFSFNYPELEEALIDIMRNKK